MAEREKISSLMDRWKKMEGSEYITPLKATFVDLPISCLEFVPWNVQIGADHPGGGPQKGRYLVVGTYFLESGGGGVAEQVVENEYHGNASTDPLIGEEQFRNGSLNLYHIQGDTIFLLQRLSYPAAILDLHFIPDSPILAVVSSTGCISLYKFRTLTKAVSKDSTGTSSDDTPEGYSNSSFTLEMIITHQLFPTLVLILSFSWLPASISSSFHPLLACTLSTGAVHLIRFSSNFRTYEVLNQSSPILSHTLQAWCCAFAPSLLPNEAPSPNEATLPFTILSGGDDSLLRIVTPASIPTTSSTGLDISLINPPAILKGHNAGVTSILPLPLPTLSSQSILLTGSYDDHIRVYALYDHRSTAANTRAKILAELNLGGGVWKMKIIRSCTLATEKKDTRSADKELSILILVSCMHVGSKIVRVKGSLSGDWTLEEVGGVDVHGSMCYGCDFVDEVENEGEASDGVVCVSTSFYDRLLCLWRVNLKALSL